jgi:hypothetical protein
VKQWKNKQVNVNSNTPKNAIEIEIFYQENWKLVTQRLSLSNWILSWDMLIQKVNEKLCLVLQQKHCLVTREDTLRYEEMWSIQLSSNYPTTSSCSWIYSQMKEGHESAFHWSNSSNKQTKKEYK